MRSAVAFLLAACLAASLSHAQPARIPDPADPAAKVPALRYESPLADFRSMKEGEAAPWKQVNEEVAAGVKHDGRPAPESAEPSTKTESAPAASKPSGHHH